MKIMKIKVLALASFVLLTNNVYATTVNNVEVTSKSIDEAMDSNVTIGGRATFGQTLADSDGDGYFEFKMPSKTNSGRFSVANYGTARIDVTVYSADTGNSVWGVRINPGKDAALSSNFSLSAGKYYFEVVSDDGSALNVLCSARY